jgi:hypothetical protein
LKGLRIENVGISYDHLEYVMAFSIFYGSFVYFMAVWYILGSLVYFMSVWYILWQFGIFYGSLVYFMAVWYTGRLWPFGIYFPFWYVWTKKNLANLGSWALTKESSNDYSFEPRI